MKLTSIAGNALGKVGKNAFENVVVSKVTVRLEKLTSRFAVPPFYVRMLIQAACKVISVVVGVIFKKTGVNTDALDSLIKGTLTTAIMQAAAHSNNEAKMLETIVSGLESPNVDKAGKFLGKWGLKASYKYIDSVRSEIVNSLNDAIADKKEGNKE